MSNKPPTPDQLPELADLKPDDWISPFEFTLHGIRYRILPDFTIERVSAIYERLLHEKTTFYNNPRIYLHCIRDYRISYIINSNFCHEFNARYMQRAIFELPKGIQN